MFDLRKTHVHQKSIFEKEVDRLIQFGGSTVDVRALPLLVTESTVDFPNFQYQFYRFVQWSILKRFKENAVDDRLDIHKGLRYTLDFEDEGSEFASGYASIFLDQCNDFLEAWVTRLVCYSHLLLDQPEYWAIKARLISGQSGWISPKGLLIKESPTLFHCDFDFLPLKKNEEIKAECLV